MSQAAETLPETRQAGPDYGIAVADRLLALVGALAAVGPASLAELAREAGCTRTAAFRLLRTLQAGGHAWQDGPRGAWRLGAPWMFVGRAASSQGALARAARPTLEALVHDTGEPAYLRVRDGQEQEIVAAAQPPGLVRLYGRVGTRGPLHAGPARLLLAHAPALVRKAVLAARLPRFTEETRTDPAWLAADLQRIIANDWLITHSELEPGGVSVTAPVRDAAGVVVAALSVSAPAIRMQSPRPRSLIPMLRVAAERLGRALDGRSPG